MRLEDYFIRFTKDLAYLDLKEDAQKKWGIGPIPLPIRLQDFLGGIENGHLDQEIEYSFFVKGMIWNLGIDPDFTYAEEYKDLLGRTVKEADRFALQMGLEAEAKGKNVDALIAFRSASIINPENTSALIHLGDLLWKIPSLSEEDREDMVHQASHILEKALDMDDRSPLANIALGQLNEGMGHYSKATAYYKRALEWAEDPEMKDEVRLLMENIEPETEIESALYFMRRADYSRSVDILSKLAKHSKRYDVYYYLGLCYQNLSAYDLAAFAFQEALDRGGDFEDLYNGWVYTLNACGKRDQALAAANKGLDRFPAALRLRFNRAILLALSGKNDRAMEDINELLSYDDLSDEFFNEIMSLREEIS